KRVPSLLLTGIVCFALVIALGAFTPISAASVHDGALFSIPTARLSASGGLFSLPSVLLTPGEVSRSSNPSPDGGSGGLTVAEVPQTSPSIRAPSLVTR